MGRKKKGCFSRHAILESVKAGIKNADENAVDKKEEENYETPVPDNETDELTSRAFSGSDNRSKAPISE